MQAQHMRHLAGRFMTKLLATFALAVGFTTAAAAATPVAVWDGDFTTASKGGYSLELKSGGALPTTVGSLSLAADVLKINKDSETTAYANGAIVVKYSGYTANATLTHTALASANVPTGSEDAGARAEGGILKSFWGTAVNRSLNAQIGSYVKDNVAVPASGYLILAYNTTAGTAVFLADANKTTWKGGCDGGIKWKGKTVQGFAIGGPRQASPAATMGPCATMTIEAVALFEDYNGLDQTGIEELMAYKFPAEATVSEPNFLLKGKNSPTGWFTGWDGEGFNNNTVAVGPATYGQVYVANNEGKHPYKGYQLPESFTLAIYCDVALIANDGSRYTSLVAAGTAGGNLAIICYKADEKKVYFRTAVGGASVLEASVAAPAVGGYHLYTATYSPSGISLTLDDDTDNTQKVEGERSRVTSGVQVGSIYRGSGTYYDQPTCLPVAAIIGFNKVLSVVETRALSAAYPGCKTFAHTSNEQVDLDNTDNKLYLGVNAGDALTLRVDSGTVLVPADVTASVTAVRYGNQSGSRNYALTVAGTLNVTGSSTTSGTGQDGIRSDVVNRRGGVFFGEWTGTGAYTVTGTLNAPDSYLQIRNDAGDQTLTVDGGTLTVKGLTTKKGATLTLQNGGTLELKESLTPSATITRNYNAGTVRALGDLTEAQAMTLGDAETGMTFDANGHVFTLTGALGGSGKAVIADSSSGHTGKVVVPSGDRSIALTVAAGGTLDVTGEAGLEEYPITTGTVVNDGTVLLNGKELDASGYRLDLESGKIVATVQQTDYEATITASVNFSAINWGKEFVESALNTATITVGEGEGCVVITFDNAALVLDQLKIISSRDVKLVASAPLSNIATIDLSECTGLRIYGWPVSALASGTDEKLGFAGGSAGDAVIAIAHGGGVLNLLGGSWTFAQSCNTTQTTVNMTDVTATYTDCFGIGTATYVLDGDTVVTTPKLVLSQDGNGRTSVLTVRGNAALNVTGNSTPDSNQSSIMFGHWNGPSTFNLEGNATFAAPDAQVLVGRTANNHTINLDGGTFTVKGIRASDQASGTNVLNLNGAAVVLGDLGFNGSKTLTVNVNEDTTITASAATLPLGQPIVIAAGKTLTVQGAEGGTAVTLAGAVTGEGKIVFGDKVTSVDYAERPTVSAAFAFTAAGQYLRFTERTSDDGIMPTFAFDVSSVSTTTRMFGADGNEIAVTDGKFTPTVAGKGALYAWEFDGSLASVGRRTDAMGRDHGPHYTDEGDAIYAYSQPYNGLTWPTEFTTAIACTLPTNANVCLVGWGKASPGGIALISGDVTKNEVKMVYWQNNQPYTVLKTMTVPNAFDCEHLYLFSKTDSGVKVYLDGSLVVNYSGALSIAPGVQVGTVFQGVPTGIIRLDTVYTQGTNQCKAVVNALRVYDAVLGPNAIAELTKEFPYVSPNGTYSRALTGTEGTWNQENAWTKTKEGEAETQVDVPGANATVVLSATDAATITVNLAAPAVYEAVNLSGEGTITFAGTGAKIGCSACKIGANAVVRYTAFDLADTPIEITAGKVLTIDASSIDLGTFYQDGEIILTGLVTADDEEGQIDCVMPAAVAGREAHFEKNATTGQWGIKVVVDGALNATVAGAQDFADLQWKLGETAVATPDWTIAKTAAVTAGEDAVLNFAADVAVDGVTLVFEGDNELSVTKGADVALSGLTFDFSAMTSVATLNASLDGCAIKAGAETVLNAVGTGSVTIAAEKMLTVGASGLAASKITNNGTLNFVGGTAEEPILFTTDTAANATLGVVTLAANTYVLNTANDNHLYTITGEGPTSCFALTKAGGGVGTTAGTAFRSMTFVAAAEEGEKVWAERTGSFDNTVDVKADSEFHLYDYNPTVRSLSGAGAVTRKDDEVLFIECGAEANYEGASSVPFVIAGTAVQTLSGAYTGTLTVSNDASAKVTGSAAMNGANVFGTLIADYAEGVTNEITALNNAGTVRIVGGTLFFRPGVTPGTVVEDGGTAVYGYTVATSITDFGKFAIPAGQEGKIRLFKPDGTELKITKTEGGYAYYEWQVEGSVCWWDYGFNGNLTSTGTDTSGMSSEGSNYYNDGNTAILVGKGTPYRGATYPTAFTAIIRAKIVDQANHLMIGFGSTTAAGDGADGNYAIAIANGDPNRDEVKLIVTKGYNVIKEVTMKVPNAYTAYHLYAFALSTVTEDEVEKSLVKVYLDGKLLQTYKSDSKIIIGKGFQVGSIHGGNLKGYSKASSANEGAELDFLRLYQTLLTDEMIKAYAEKYPYISVNGKASRAFAGAADWTSDETWTQIVGETVTQQSRPNGGTMVEISATADAEVTMDLDEATTYEQLDVLAGSAITLKKGGTQKPGITGFTTVGADLTVDYDAVSFANITILEGQTLTFDFAGLDVSGIYQTTTIDLTGLVTLGEGASIEAANLPKDAARTLTFRENPNNGHWELLIEVPSHPFVITVAQGETTGTWTWNGEEVSTEVVEANAGVLIAKEGEGTHAATINRNYEVRAGTLKASGVGTATVTVCEGGVFDINGGHDPNYTIVLAGGKLVNNGNAVGVGTKQFNAISLTADSEIGGASEFGYISGGWGANTLDLGGATLTKTGDFTFTLCHTTVSNGKVLVSEGTLGVEKSAVTFGADAVLEIGAGADLAVKDALTAPTIVGEGTVTVAADKTLTVGTLGDVTLAGAGAVTVTNRVNYAQLGGNVTLADGATVMFPARETRAIRNLAPTYAGSVTVDAAEGARLVGTFVFPATATFTPAFTAARKASGLVRRVEGDTIVFFTPFTLIIR